MKQQLNPPSTNRTLTGQTADSSVRSLKEWLCLLEARHPSEIDLGLERVAKVAHALNLAQPANQTITVAGTNGKGSAVAIMESILLNQGRRVGTYTSPHLLNYNERVRINGLPVDDLLLCQAFTEIEVARGDISLSYFEFGTLAALLIFAAAELDVALLEVGLGGRLDAVNIVDADVGIITNIALDHESWLGDNREQIALEKAGIARANRPVVCADQDLPATLLPQLKILGARPYVLGSADFCFRKVGEKITLKCTDNSGEHHTYSDLPLPNVPLPSALCAVQALLLLGEPVIEQTLQQVFSMTRLAGRLQALRLNDRNIILDVAHNPAAAQLLARNLETRKSGKIHALFSAMADKNIVGIILPLCNLVQHWHIPEQSMVSRAAKAVDIVNTINYGGQKNVECSAYKNIDEAMKKALKLMQPEDTLIGFGSFFTVADILSFIEKAASTGDIVDE